MTCALVVFESMFGNTYEVAKAIADGLASQMPVELVEVGDAPTVISDDVSLLLVGGPTHAFGMSRQGTRQTAAEQAEQRLVSTGIGLREWLRALDPAAQKATVATFDTVLVKPRWVSRMGTAARQAEKQLRRRGLRIAAPAESFYVTDTSGPLVAGEQQRAHEWGERLGSEHVAAQPQ
jgi:hypothetical protein